MLHKRHLWMTIFIAAGLMAFGSACSDKDKAARQMAQDAQARIQALEAKAATDGQCGKMLTACRGSLNTCMANTANPPPADMVKTCMSGFDACMQTSCQ